MFDAYRPPVHLIFFSSEGWRDWGLQRRPLIRQGMPVLLDGSWAEITLAAENGQHAVAEGGPRRLWHLIENAHRTWTDLDRPGWDRFGLTVTPQTHTVWFDQPDSDHTWQLAAR